MAVEWLMQKKNLILKVLTVLENFLVKMRFSQSRVMKFVLVFFVRCLQNLIFIMSTVINNANGKSVYESITNEYKTLMWSREKGDMKENEEERWKIYYKINDGSMDVKITKTSSK